MLSGAKERDHCVARLMDPGDLCHLYEKPFKWRSLFKNGISWGLALAQAVKILNSSSTRSTRDTRHKSYETWDVYEHVRLETPETSEDEEHKCTYSMRQ